MIPRSQIRRSLVRSGQHREDPDALGRRVEALFHWLNDVTLRRLRRRHGIPGGRTAGAGALMQGVKFTNQQMLERNCEKVLEQLRQRTPAYLYGSGAGWAALAFAYQLVFTRGYRAVYRELSDLKEALETGEDLSAPAKTLTVLDVSFDPSDGKIWASDALRIKAKTRGVEGPVIIIHSKSKYAQGPFGELVTKEIWRPDLRLEVKKR